MTGFDVIAIVAFAPLFLIGAALANAVYQSWTHRDDDHGD